MVHRSRGRRGEDAKRNVLLYPHRDWGLRAETGVLLSNTADQRGGLAGWVLLGGLILGPRIDLPKLPFLENCESYN